MTTGNREFLSPFPEKGRNGEQVQNVECASLSFCFLPLSSFIYFQETCCCCRVERTLDFPFLRSPKPVFATHTHKRVSRRRRMRGDPFAKRLENRARLLGQQEESMTSLRCGKRRDQNMSRVLTAVILRPGATNPCFPGGASMRGNQRQR